MSVLSRLSVHMKKAIEDVIPSLGTAGLIQSPTNSKSLSDDKSVIFLLGCIFPLLPVVVA
ncbi:MAG TPA: hypothetical protein VJM08_00410 [Anaerolineales bacterium]|nr:hypothetical protein [Anaerolineales bacterium]